MLRITYFTTEPSAPPSRPASSLKHASQLYNAMPPPSTTVNNCQEQYIFLAQRELNCDAFLSERRAAQIFDVKRSTLRDRRKGKLPRAETAANCKKLDFLEEQAIIARTLDLDSRGFPPSKVLMRAMADDLLAAKGAKPTGSNWVDRFIKRRPEIKTVFNRAYDLPRAKAEDPDIIRKWFTLVANTKAKYGLLDEDTYNFDESSFMMGVIGS